MIKNLILLFLGCMIAFGIGEVAVRAIGEGRPVTGYRYSYVKHSLYNPFLVFGPNIDRKVPHMEGDTIYWNTQGFRLNEVLPKTKGF